MAKSVRDKIKNVSQQEAMSPAKMLEGANDYSGLDVGVGSGERKSIPNRYYNIGTKNNWSPFALPKDMEREAYLKQSGGEVFWNSLKGFGNQAAAGFLKALGSWDLEGIYDMASGNTQKDYGNWLTRKADDILENAEEKNVIFQDGDSMWNTSYWAKQFQSLGFTAGIIGETVAEQVGLAYLTGGTGNLESLGTKANLLRSLNKQFAFGSFKGVQESYMNALETQGQVYNKYKELGYDEETAKRKGAEAATLNFRAETGPLMVLNGLQYAATFGAGTKLSSAFKRTPGLSQGFSGAMESVTDRLLPNITNKWVKGGVGALANMTSEAFEEGMQTGIQKYAQHKTLQSTGNADGDFNLFDSEMRDSMIGGFLGGGVFSMAGKLLEPLTHGTAAKKYDYLHDTFLNNAPNRTFETFQAKQLAQDNYQKALKEYENDKSDGNKIRLQQAENNYKQSQTNTHLTNTLNSLYLDYLTGKTTAFESHTEQMQNILDAVNNNDTEALKKFQLIDDKGNEKFEGSFDLIKKTFPQNIQDSHTVKNMLDNNLTNTTADFESAWDITKKEFLNTSHVKDMAEYNRMLTEHYTNDTQFNQLSAEGKQRFQLESELAALKSLDRFKPLSENNKERAEEITDTLEKLGKYNSNDKLIIPSMNKTLYEKGYTALAVSKEEISQNNRELSDLRDQNKIKERIKQRTRERVRDASTKEELKDTKEKLEKTGQLDEDLKQDIVQKEKELTAKEVSNEISKADEVEKPIAEPVESVPDETVMVKTSADKVMGNASLFGEAVNEFQQVKKDTDLGFFDEKSQREAEFLLSPATIDSSKFTPEYKERIKSATSNMLAQLSPDASFEDLVRAFMSHTNKNVADEHFNLLKEGWKLVGKPEEDYNDVYNKLFANPVSEYLEVGKNVFTESKTEEQKEVVQSNTQEQEKVLQKELGTPKVDSNNQVVYQYTGVVTDNEKPKLATLFRLYDSSNVINDDGTVTTNYEYTSDELNEGQYVDSRPLLNPDAFLPGTEMEVKVPSNFLDILVPVYNSDGTKGQAITFGQYIAQHNLTPEMQEYKDKLPMIVYRKNATSEEKGLAFIHDIGWYHPERFLQSEPGKMQQAISHTREIREAAINQNGTSITITEKKTTSFEPFKTKNNGTKERPNYDFIPFSEANPNAVFLVAESSEQLQDNEVFNNNDNIVLRNTPFKAGYVYDLRRVGVKDGKKTWIAFEVAPQPINNDVKTTIKQALNIFLNKNNTNSAVREKHDSVVKQIQKQTGLNILLPNDLKEYLHQFINFRDFEKAQNNKDVDAIMNVTQGSNRTDNPGYIGFQIGGAIYIGARKLNAFGDDKSRTQTIYSNSNKFDPKSVSRLLEWLDKKYIPSRNSDGSAGSRLSILDTLSNNYSKKAAKSSKPVLMIDADGNVKQVANNYRQYTMDTFTTNIKSQNISKEGEKPVYVTATSMISYDLTSNINKANETLTTTQVVSNAVQPDVTLQTKVSEATTNQLEENLDELVKQISEKAAKDLGIDFDNLSNLDLLSVAALTEEQRKEFNSQDNRLANLTPKENRELNDFIFNQITPLLDKNGTVTDKEIFKTIQTTINNILKPVQDYYKSEAKRLQELLDTKPQLNETNVPMIIQSYNKESQRIAELQDKNNLKSLFKASKERVTSNLGVKETQVDETKLNADGEYSEQNQEEKEGWQVEALSVDPNAKTSAALKRFYSSIPILDKDGNPKKGIFGLPLYYSLQEVGTLAKAILADTPSDFNMMIDKLSEKQQYSWIPQLVEKLKAAPNQIQKQFVSDMSMSALKMKFSMIIFDKKTNAYKTKVWDANQGGIIDQILYNWSNSFEVSDLILKDTDEEGNIQLNKEKAKLLIQRFNSWIGMGVSELKSDISDYINQIKQVKKDKPVIISPATNTRLHQELHTNLVRVGQRISFKLSQAGTKYQIVNKGDNKFEISFFEDVSVTKEEAENWLESFGISLSKDAVNELFEKGLYHNYKQQSFKQLFETGGLFRELYNSLSFAVEKEGDYFYDESGKEPVREGVVKSLAALEYKYNSTITPTGGYMNGKNFYPITQNKFATERANALKEQESKTRDQLKKLSFSKNSMYLQLLENEKFRQNFELSHIAFNAMQILGKNVSKDNAINKLSSLDYEISTLGMFWDMNQGTIESPYEIPMRMATMLMPTMSDKQVGLWLKTAVLDLSNKHLNSGREISDQVKEILYQQVVKPELERMLSFTRNGSKTDIKGYDDGAKLFMFIPKLNELELVEGLTLREAVTNSSLSYNLTMERIEGNKALMNKIYDVINETINSIKEEKVEAWKRDGIIETNNEGTITKVNFIDDHYFNKSNKFNGTLEEKVNMAILDTAVNQMIHLANSFMLFAGDPALYYKKDGSTSATDFVQIVKDSFVNVGKRLANQIAPGIKLAQSENEQYLQLFINDRKTIGDKNFIKYTTEILDGKSISDEDYDFVKEYLGKSKKDLSTADVERYKKIKSTFSNSAGFFEIEGSDAQEYTTWQEHLNILEKLGRTPDVISDITIQDIAEARKLFSSGKTKEDLTDREKALVGLIMQPIKPVYTGQIYDETQDVMRTMYIKSSSFPLIPQLTQGLEIDKLRVAMEKLQDSKKMNVRASYQTANKVGAIKNAIDLWDANGRAIDDNIEVSKLGESSMILNRKDFRIQQDVPFKSGKNSEDKVTMGTQLMKLLFGNDIINFEGFEYQGKSDWTGRDLWNEFNQLHINLVELKKGQLFDELGLDKTGKPIDAVSSTQKIQDLLYREAKDRGFPQQVLDGLELQEDGSFTLPLWSSINSNKFESLLNAIVVNRLSRIKFPGNSYVAGSPEGFQSKMKMDGEENLSPETQSQIVYSNSWDGESLKASFKENGKVKKVQVLVGSKFRNADGSLVNLLDDEWSYIDDKGVRRLRQDKFDDKLFNLTSFRIPTTGISSASQIEIVGFLPYSNADLMILPANLTKQKGLDFDIDKENTYQYWHYLTNEGRFEVLNENHRTELLSKVDKLAESGNENIDNLMSSIFSEMPDYTEDEINEDSKLKKKNSDIQAKLIQNKIIEIYQSVLSNPDNKIQAKINSILNTDYSESEALFIENLKPSNKTNWTPLSGEYQKQKMALGAGGKIGTGAYSMDVVFHSLAQQAKAMGKPMQLMEIIGEGEDVQNLPKKWRFGKLQTGGIESDGVLGNTNTLDETRSTSDLLNETAQIAVDNEKLQIMGKVNLNDLTLDVHKVFNLLGVDKFNTKDKHSVAFLFMSQPILKDYVLRLSNSKSNLATFEADKKEKIIKDLMGEYYPEYATQELNDEEFSDLMSEDNMVEAIKAVNPKQLYGKLQAGVLLRFLDMEKYGLAIRNIQTTLNVDSKGLGKSFFDVVSKKDKLAKLGDGSFVTSNGQVVGSISNVTGLVGEYINKPSSQEEVQSYIDKGYYLMENPSMNPDAVDYLIKPNTFLGAFNIVTTNTAYNLWKEYLPYNSKILQAIYNEILPLIESETAGSDSRTIENKQDILSEFKKYLATFRTAGFIGKEDDINEERKRLYIDSETNTSLASYISELLKVKNNPVIDNFIKSNKLFNSFEFKLNKTGEPSLIKFNNTKGESWDEQFLYEALGNLLEVRGKNGTLQLPKIGNKQYTLDTLAQDLIAYAMIGNAKQEAIQFTKYVPVQYMNMMGYSYMMRVLHNKLTGKASEESIANTVRALGIVPKTDETKHYTSEFTTQFVQHNPQLVKYTLDSKEMNKKLIQEKGAENSFLLDSDDKPTFIKVYDPRVKGKKKFRLFKFNGKSYNQIPVLGVFGMDEYQFGNNIGTSITNQNFKGETTLQPLIDKKAVTPLTYGIGNDNINVKVALENIAKDSTSSFAKLANILLPYVSDTEIQVKDAIMRNGQPFYNFNGGWNPATKMITVNPKILGNSELLAQTVLHEVVHGLTYDKVQPYIELGNNNDVFVKSNSPKYVQDLVALFNNVRKGVNKDMLDHFIANMDNVTNEEKSKYYGYTNIHEFMTMALTDKGFQEQLNKIEYKNTGKSLLDKFKEIIKSILQDLGVQFDENYTAAHAISSIFGVITEAKQEEKSNPYQSLKDEGDNIDDSKWIDGEEEGQLSVMTFDYPEIKFNIPNTECI